MYKGFCDARVVKTVLFIGQPQKPLTDCVYVVQLGADIFVDFNVSFRLFVVFCNSDLCSISLFFPPNDSLYVQMYGNKY